MLRLADDVVGVDAADTGGAGLALLHFTVHVYTPPTPVPLSRETEARTQGGEKYMYTLVSTRR